MANEPMRTDQTVVRLPEQEQYNSMVVVSEDNVTLGGRVRQAGDSFMATDLDPTEWRMVKDGRYRGVEVKEGDYTKMLVRVPDITVGFVNGLPVTIPGDRRANSGQTVQAHPAETKVAGMVATGSAPTYGDVQAARVAGGQEPYGADADTGDSEAKPGDLMRLAAQFAQGVTATSPAPLDVELSSPVNSEREETDAGRAVQAERDRVAAENAATRDEPGTATPDGSGEHEPAAESEPEAAGTPPLVTDAAKQDDQAEQANSRSRRASQK
jgi:hypothetical protein